MAGITRINIIDTIGGVGAWRFQDSQKLYPVANMLYRQIFESIGSPLEDGDDVISCTMDNFKAGYDYMLGIDTLLRTVNGQILTMQEKFLFTKYNTVTVEYMQNAQEQGDWFKLKCQVYFVGYNFPKTFDNFTSWILLDWAQLVLATQKNDVAWFDQMNRLDGARASFKYVRLADIPDYCVIARGGLWDSYMLPSESHSLVTQTVPEQEVEDAGF